ncbi:hypothetical protein RIEGSTA812A_PEG_1224 [invertebrate metagenome]|uniref:Uncharacterized protein n=1 Tax=invertebrate metagenome TaxID=1711999 RepID=A0A484H822_9ZZZZ
MVLDQHYSSAAGWLIAERGCAAWELKTQMTTTGDFFLSGVEKNLAEEYLHRDQQESGVCKSKRRK